VLNGPLCSRPFRFKPHLAAWALVLAVLACPGPARAQQPAADTVPGQRFIVEEPITSDTVARLKDAAKALISRNASLGKDPVLIFEFRPGKVQPGRSTYGASHDLAEVLVYELAGAKKIAYVPEPLKGYAVLPALACDEIVMGRNASIGPITPEGESVRAHYRDSVKNLAINKGREPALFLGLLDRDADLRAVRTADKQLHYLLAADVAEFGKTHQILEDRSAWEGTQRGVLLADRAREENFTKLLSDDVSEVLNTYRVTGGLSADPSLLAEPKAVWIKLDGQINASKERFIAQRIQKARADGVNLIFFEINSEGGIDSAATNIAQQIADVSDMKTVAYVEDRALGVAALIPLACDDIVLQRGAKIGNVASIRAGGRDEAKLSAEQTKVLADWAAEVCKKKGHPAAVAEAMIDPSVVVVSATDSKTGAAGFYNLRQIEAEPGRFLDVTRVKEPGSVRTYTADEVASFGLGQRAADVEEMKGLYRLKGKTIRVDGPTWVDGLVHTLNDPFVGFILLFVGIFMLILEIKMPGVGLPAITSVLAFLLFFWSRFLSGTADQLEILLFLVGLICLGLELFVFPGLGVFGVSGVILILISIVMASHTFIWPSQEYEYRQMLSTLFQVTAVLVSAGVGIAFIGRFLPSIPLFNKLILRPEPWDGLESDDPNAKPSGAGESSLSFLMGETGRTTTVLRPMGKARFGEMLVDVSADGFYLEPDTLVEVVDIQGTRVVVRPVD
jgi:membrane-bound serine protease (ClpP class)